MNTRKAYLGDGVYADVDRGMIVLTTEDGRQVTNTIYLEPEVFDGLTEYVEKLKQVNDGSPVS